MRHTGSFSAIHLSLGDKLGSEQKKSVTRIMLLILNGKNARDIFEVLLIILKQKCVDFFGEVVCFPRKLVDFERNFAKLESYFKDILSIKLEWIIQEKAKKDTMKEEKKDPVLKDYKLVLPLTNAYANEISEQQFLCINFDYHFHHSSPSLHD